MKLKGAKIVWECLTREGVEVVFGYPGGANMPIYDAMLDYPVHHVLVRHEQGGAQRDRVHERPCDPHVAGGVDLEGRGDVAGDHVHAQLFGSGGHAGEVAVGVPAPALAVLVDVEVHADVVEVDGGPEPVELRHHAGRPALGFPDDADAPGAIAPCPLRLEWREPSKQPPLVPPSRQ